MSGSSRISGHGSYAGTGGEQSRSESLKRFCRGRKVGDVITGVYLRDESEALGWTLLEGEELLAQLPINGPRPQEGHPVYFSIESLAPDVVLRMLPGDAVAARIATAMPPLPLAQNAGLYRAAREKFDVLWAAEGQIVLSHDIASREREFSATVAANPGLLSAFAETLVRSRALCRAGASAGLVFFRYMPWLSRAVTGLEVSLWSQGESPVLAGCVLPGGDRVTLRGRFEGDVLRYTLGITLGSAGGSYPFPETSMLQRTHGEYRGMEPVREGKTATAQGLNGDIVGRILTLAVESGTVPVGRFSRRL